MGDMDIMAAAFDTPRVDGGFGLNIIIEGESGSGKSALMRRLARRKRAHCEVLIPILKESTEFGGQPFLNEKILYKDGKAVAKERELALAPAAWGKRIAAGKRSLTVVEEGNAASMSVFGAMMQCVLDNQLGDFDLGPGNRWVLLMNPLDIASQIGGVELPPQFLNRFGKLIWSPPPFEQWVDHVRRSSGVHEEDEEDEYWQDDGDADAREARILKAWGAHYEKSVTEVVTFLSSKPDRLQQFPRTAEAQHQPWCSRRSWADGAIRARASAALHKLSADDSLKFQAAFVGLEAVRELNTFTRNQDLPDPRKWLAGEATFTPSDDRPDRTQSFLVSVGLTFANMPKGKRDKELNRLVSFAKTLDGRRDTVVRAFYTFAKTLGAKEIMDLPQDLEKFFHEIGSVASRADVNNARGRA